MQGDARAPLLGTAGILPGEGVAEAVGFGVAVENKQVGVMVWLLEVSPYPLSHGTESNHLCPDPRRRDDPAVGELPRRGAIAAGVLRQQRGALAQALMLALQPGDLRLDLRQLVRDKLLHPLPGEVIEAGDAREQGNQLPSLQPSRWASRIKPDPLQILGPVDAILAARLGSGSSPSCS